MASVPGEIADAIVTALSSPAVETTVEATVAAGEVPLQTLIDTTIANIKGTGILGLVITAGKGTVEAEINAEFAKLPPATIVAFLLSLAKTEAKNLGG